MMNWHSAAFLSFLLAGMITVFSSLLAQDGDNCDIIATVSVDEAPASSYQDASLIQEGADYFFGFGGEQDFNKALQYFSSAADNNSLPAINIIGAIYLKGWAGVEPDFECARKQFEIAAKSSYAPAQNNLGVIWENGIGIDKNSDLAHKYFLGAAEHDYAPALNNLGVWHVLHSDPAGTQAVGVKYLESAAAQGYVPSLFNLASVYHEGKLVERDYQKAAEYYLRAAESGDPYSQFNVGLMYALGRGVDRNVFKGYSWLLSAEVAGVEQAKFARAALEAIMDPEEVENGRILGLTMAGTYDEPLVPGLEASLEDLYVAPELLYYRESVLSESALDIGEDGKLIRHHWLEPYSFN